MSSHSLDLSHLPPTFLLPTQLAQFQVNDLTSQLLACKCPLASTPAVATVFLGDINTTRRCEFELRGRRLKLSPTATPDGREIKVVKLKWFTESQARSTLLPIEDYVVYSGYLEQPREAVFPEAEKTGVTRSEKLAADQRRREGILERARRDRIRIGVEKEIEARDELSQQSELSSTSDRQRRGIGELMAISRPKDKAVRRPGTPEYEEEREKIMSRGRPRTIKDMPDWVQRNNNYSCCRPTPLVSPNAAFIALLDTIKFSRILASEDIGVRAYSTAIASLQAYPYPLISPSEVTLLPGCSEKIASLFQEFVTSANSSISVVDGLLASPSFTTLKLFASIWGVGPVGARDFYYDRGWRSLDDIIDHGWNSLTRAQQVGVKYFDEFASAIPRAEAEAIAATVGAVADKVRPGMQYTIVGGYRRGKTHIHDVDIMLSHTNHAQTTGGFIRMLVAALEQSGHITHTLHLGGEAVDTRAMRAAHGYGFDLLDKALVVFLSPTSGLHRRVDIIIAPPVSVGSALLGWTGATTFERDLRLWCDKQRGWKFTTEGVWTSAGRVAEVGGDWKPGEEMVDAERRLMEGIGLKWLEPSERCTG